MTKASNEAVVQELAAVLQVALGGSRAGCPRCQLDAAGWAVVLPTIVRRMGLVGEPAERMATKLLAMIRGVEPGREAE